MNKLAKTISSWSLVVGLASALAGNATAGEFDGVTLKVATWGGSWKANIEKIIVPKFEALGGKIEFVTGSPAANFAKLVAGRGRAPFDVMEILDAQVGDFAQVDYLQSIDLDLIPNKSNLQPFQYNETYVGSWNTQETICYNTEKFKELGLAAPKSYADLAAPELADKVSLPDINSGAGLANFGGYIYAAGGNEENIAPGLELLQKINATKFWTRGGETKTQFETGDIYAAVVHAGWCARAARAGSPVMTVHPAIKSGVNGLAKEGWLGIMKSSENVKASHWFINEYLTTDFQYEFAINSGVFPLNQASIDMMRSDEINARLMEMDAGNISSMLRIDYSKVDKTMWIDGWNKTLTAN
ncbi:extracellular solute-binding protein [Alphaproteobacteria bacterium]|jgi:putative spermidine/putrescine transport system substrate-binding protein|nr:extracellular solute-binding protein [Alphaproteobacteria bacterium]